MKNELDALRCRFNSRTPQLMDAIGSYAVLCPLTEKEDGLHLLFEVRAAGLRQAGETCFPGGRMEAGETAAACALRETEEELSVPASEITLLGMPDFIHNQRGFLLQPVLGLVSPAGLEALRPSPDEVAGVFTVPLSFFRENEPEVYTCNLLPKIAPDFPYEEVGVSPDYPWATGQVDVPVWHYENHAIWGMTARIVRHLLSAL